MPIDRSLTAAPWAWEHLLSGGIMGPDGRARDLVRGRIGVRDSGVIGRITAEGYASEHDQLANATGERIDLGEFPFLNELTAMVRVIPRAGSGDVYAQMMARGDGVFGTDTNFSFGWRPGGTLTWFNYGRAAGSLLGTEGSTSVLVNDTPITVFARWRSAVQQLWAMHPTAGWVQVLSSTSSGVGSAGTNLHLWLGGSGNMTANASQASPPATILAWGVWGYFMPESAMRYLGSRPYAPYRQVRTRPLFVVAGGGTPQELEATGTVAVEGTAVLHVEKPLASTGEVAVQGTAALSVGKPLAATGTVQAEGSAELGVEKPLAATGVVLVEGYAQLSGAVEMEAHGTVQVQGTATLSVGKPLGASGEVLVQGSADLYRLVALATVGSVAVQGSADLEVQKLLAASGEVLVEGSANLQVGELIIVDYLTGTLTVRPALLGSLTVSPALTGTLTVEPV